MTDWFSYTPERIRRITRQNGWLLVLASPITFLIAVLSLLDPPLATWYDAAWRIPLAIIVCAAWLVPGILAIRWANRPSPPEDAHGNGKRGHQ